MNIVGRNVNVPQPVHGGWGTWGSEHIRRSEAGFSAVYPVPQRSAQMCAVYSFHDATVTIGHRQVDTCEGSRVTTVSNPWGTWGTWGTQTDLISICTGQEVAKTIQNVPQDVPKTYPNVPRKETE